MANHEQRTVKSFLVFSSKSSTFGPAISRPFHTLTIHKREQIAWEYWKYFDLKDGKSRTKNSKNENENAPNSTISTQNRTFVKVWC